MVRERRREVLREDIRRMQQERTVARASVVSAWRDVRERAHDPLHLRTFARRHPAGAALAALAGGYLGARALRAITRRFRAAGSGGARFGLGGTTRLVLRTLIARRVADYLEHKLFGAKSREAAGPPEGRAERQGRSPAAPFVRRRPVHPREGR